MARFAAVVAALVACRSVAASPRPTRPDRSSSGSPRDRSMHRTSSRWPKRGSGRSASCSNGGPWSEPGAPTTGSQGIGWSGRLPRAEYGPFPFVWGSPNWVNAIRRASPGRHRGQRTGVAELPPGGRGALRARRQLLDQRLPRKVRAGREAAADPVVADLERAQSEQVLRPRANGPACDPKVRSAALALARRDQEPGPAGPDCARRHARLRGLDGLEVPRQPLPSARGEGRLRRRRPAPLCARPRLNSTSKRGRSGLS